jgi:hypothetical protein
MWVDEVRKKIVLLHIVLQFVIEIRVSKVIGVNKV